MKSKKKSKRYHVTVSYADSNIWLVWDEKTEDIIAECDYKKHALILMKELNRRLKQ